MNVLSPRDARPAGDLTAVILAGGMGTRLRPVVSDRPKVLAEVNGAPFILYLLEWLAGHGVKNVTLCTGYGADAIQSELGSERGLLRLTYAREAAPLGTGGALRNAWNIEWSDPVLVLNGDSYHDVNLSEMVRAHRQNQAVATLALCEVPDASRFGSVQIGPDGRMMSFLEKQPEERPGWINAGIYLMANELLGGLPPGRACSLEREVFPSLLGGRFFGFRSGNSEFIDIGTPASYRAASAFFARHPLRRP
jgi:NDP-sugar pyrophosphorylase family protein